MHNNNESKDVSVTVTKDTSSIKRSYKGGVEIHERQLQHFLLYKDGYFFDRRGNVTKQINQQNIIFDPFSYYKASFFDGFTGKETIQK